VCEETASACDWAWEGFKNVTKIKRGRKKYNIWGYHDSLASALAEGLIVKCERRDVVLATASARNGIIIIVINININIIIKHTLSKVRGFGCTCEHILARTLRFHVMFCVLLLVDGWVLLVRSMSWLCSVIFHGSGKWRGSALMLVGKGG